MPAPAYNTRVPEYSVEVRKAIAADPQRVYDAWLTPADWDAWFTNDSQIDARLGGRYVNGDGDTGEYLELEPGRLIRFSWENASACPGSEVAVTLTPTADGTELLLVHNKLPQPETGRGEMIDGWGWAIDNLAAYLEGRPTCDHDTWVARKYGNG
jgi:uncharacterized protein YndB with AHSA1/START domain